MAVPVWFKHAACRGLGSQEFVKDPANEHYSSWARQLCARCPVRPQCLELALRDPSIYGLWGGTDDRERREMRRHSGGYGRRAG
jgi:WhiB family redox-sensing transcriptional regulator